MFSRFKFSSGEEIVELKKKFNFRLLVDDAHGFGTLGKTGAGAGEEQGIQDDIDVYFATFAKSLAGIGAFLSADKEIIDYLKYNLRSQMFAKSLPMIYVKGDRFDSRSHGRAAHNAYQCARVCNLFPIKHHNDVHGF